MKLQILTALLALFGLGSKAAASITAESSWYGAAHHGKPMANGKPFNMHALTVATWDYPLGTWLNVEYVAPSGRVRSVIVQVTDRGPNKRLVAQGRRFDLSFAAFRRLESPRKGIIRVKATPIKHE